MITELIGCTVLAVDLESQPPNRMNMQQFETTPAVCLLTNRGKFWIQLTTGGWVIGCWIEHIEGLENLSNRTITGAQIKDLPNGGQMLEFTTDKGFAQIEQRTEDPYGYGAGFEVLGFE